MIYLDIIEAKKIYEKGKNITQYLKKKFDISQNTPEIIEIAYDIQAGSYIKKFENNKVKTKLYANELGGILNKHVTDGDSLLDIGTGELTTLTLMLNQIKVSFSEILAFDISWSRLKKGKDFFKLNKKKSTFKVSTFVADIESIPLHSKCIDVVTSSHALEPNGKNLSLLLNELFRITKKKLVLFEPSYELNSIKGKKRMSRLGYIKGIVNEVENLGGKIQDIIPLRNSLNSLNPTACYLITPPPSKSKYAIENKPVYCVPGSNFKLKKGKNYFISKDTGLLFPVIESLPILRKKIWGISFSKVLALNILYRYSN